MRASLIIAAGGSGERFQKSFASVRNVPSKLFFPLLGKPVLAHTIAAFEGLCEIKEILVAVPSETKSWVKKSLKTLNGRLKVLAGGNTRAQSVWKALCASDRKNPWIMVHDGARPLVTQGDVRRLFHAAHDCDGVLLARKVVPTIKESTPDHFVQRTIDRSFLYEAETPQLARRSILEKAYRDYPGAFQATDEASLVEAMNGRVKIVAHDSWNPKLTTAEDLRLIENYLAGNSRAEIRTGIGRDTHRLVFGRPFWLGGTRIRFEKGPLGHSDGDALLHAVTDAVLGAIGGGDIGEWFSDRDPKNKNISSSTMLAHVLEEARGSSWRPVHADTVVILEKPKLADYKRKMAANIAKLLNLPPDAVSVKAKTTEGLGPEGKGLAITCEAIVTMKKWLD